MRLPLLSVFIVALTISACSSAPQRITSVGRYGDVPAQPSRGFSRVQAFDATFDEAWDSSRQLIARMGLFVEETDKAKGKFTGNGVWQNICVGGPCSAEIVYAVYLKEIKGREPRVELTMMADTPQLYDWQGKGHSVQLINRFVADLQKSLAAQR